jgi:hypothetical protein
LFNHLPITKRKTLPKPPPINTRIKFFIIALNRQYLSSFSYLQQFLSLKS